MPAVIVWFLTFLGAWWVIAEGRVDGWPVALAAAALAVLVRHRLGAPEWQRWRGRGLLRFVPYFLWQSLRGGADVALRAVRRPLPIAPGVVEHRLVLPPGPARTLFVVALSLLPGTFSADLDGDRLSVHVLDTTGRIADDVRRLEVYVGAVFGVVVPQPGGDGR